MKQNGATGCGFLGNANDSLPSERSQRRRTDRMSTRGVNTERERWQRRLVGNGSDGIGASRSGNNGNGGQCHTRGLHVAVCGPAPMTPGARIRPTRPRPSRLPRRWGGEPAGFVGNSGSLGEALLLTVLKPLKPDCGYCPLKPLNTQPLGRARHVEPWRMGPLR